MGGMRMALALLLAIALAAPAQAQGTAPPPSATRPSAPPQADAPAAATPPAAPRNPAIPESQSAGETGTPAVDATKLGVSMSRIRKGLRINESRESVSGTPFKLEYQVQVFGAAPRIDILQGFDIGQRAPLPYGAPTHNDFVTLWTPQAYRSPPASLSSLAGWAMFKLGERSKKSKCEEEIANYRQLVMQGVATVAPRCTQ